MSFEVSLTVLMKSIILSMDRACSYLSKTTVQSIINPLQAEIVMLGSVITGTGGICCCLGEWYYNLNFRRQGVYTTLADGLEIMVMLCWEEEEGDTTIFRFVMLFVMLFLLL